MSFEILIDIPEPIDLFIYLKALWGARTNSMQSSERLLARCFSVLEKNKNEQRKDRKDRKYKKIS